jgi:hypothetical protein
VLGARNPSKLIGAIGVLGFLVPAMGSVLWAPTWDFPATGSDGGAIAAYVVEHRDALRAGVALDVVGVTLWGIFGMGVWLRLRSEKDGENILSACFLFGIASLVTLLLAGFLCFLVLAYRSPEVSDPRLLYDLAFGLLAVSGLPTAVALGAYALQTFQSGQLPRWTAMLAAVGAVAHVVLLASFFVSEGFFSLEGQVITVIPATLFAWLLGTGIALIRDQGMGAAGTSRR